MAFESQLPLDECTERMSTEPPDTESCQDYLKLALTTIEDIIERMTQPSVFVKIHQHQCQLLVEKLVATVDAAHNYINSAPKPEIISCCQHICKTLWRVAEGVKGLADDCCEEKWVRAAIILGDQTECVSLFAFELNFCRALLHQPNEYWSDVSFERRLTALYKVRETELGIIKEKACVDRQLLLQSTTELFNHSKYIAVKPEEIDLLDHLMTMLQSGSMGSLGSHETVHKIWACKVGYESLKRLDKLGKGSFAYVYRTTWLGLSFAEKNFFAADDHSFRIFMNEVSIFARLFHPNVVPLYCYATDSRSYSLVMELMDEDLHHFMRERMRKDATLQAPFEDLEALDILLQIAEGMYYLHKNKVVHRDLKSENILVKLIKPSGDIDHVKVSDFGLSKVKEISHTFSNLTPNTGTTRWMAPELYSHDAANHADSTSNPQRQVLRFPFKSDVYSFGMVCYETLTGELPFSMTPTNKVRKTVNAGLRPEIPPRYPNRLSTMISKCWDANPSARPNFAEICLELRQVKCQVLLAGTAPSHRSEKTPSTPEDQKSMVEEAAYIQQHFNFAISYRGQDKTFFPMNDIRDCTNNFGSKSLVGGGSYGQVYAGRLCNRMAAIKRLYENPFFNSNFRTQVLIGSRLQHPNVVELIGYGHDGRRGVLVYELAPMSSLHSILHEKQLRAESNFGRTLDWTRRLTIAIDVAKGLEYIHASLKCFGEKAHPYVYHPRIKSSNILLFDGYKAKIEYATYNSPSTPEGLSFPESDELQSSHKKDVYDFGVVLLELLTGRKVVDHTSPIGNPDIVDWAIPIIYAGHKGDELQELIDPTLRRFPSVEVSQMASLAAECVQNNLASPPNMAAVVKRLQNILETRDAPSLTSLPQERNLDCPSLVSAVSVCKPKSPTTIVVCKFKSPKRVLVRKWRGNKLGGICGCFGHGK